MDNPSKQIKVLSFSGSLRKASYTTMLVKAFQQLAPSNIEMEIADIGNLPLINQDLEENLPEPVRALHSQIGKADAILLATPEYNRSYSPVLKNALDWGSRPQGQNKWAHKPVMLLGCTPYQLGAFGAVNHLRQVVMYLDMPVLQQPEFYLGKAGERFDKNGNLIDQETKKMIDKIWNSFITLIDQVKAK